MSEFVLVHGYTESPAGWDRLAGALRAGGSQVTAIDQPAWTVEINAGHCPQLSQPVPLAGLLAQI